MAQIAILAVTAAIEVGSLVYRLLNMPKLRPPVSDLQISQAIDGGPIPFGYGDARIGGTLIWAPGLTDVKAGVPGGGGSNFFGGAQQFDFFANFAFAFGEGPGTIIRIWGDSKLIYDSSPLVSEYPASDFPAWSSTTLYTIGSIVSYNGLVYDCTQQNTGIFPGQTADETGGILYWEQLGSYTPFDVTATYNPGDVTIFDGQLFVNLQTTSDPAHTPTNSHYWRLLNAYYGVPTIYPGTQTQTVDPLIQANEGVSITPAFRPLIYAVWENMPLANFGNRIPNVRAEISFGNARGPYIADQAFQQNLEPSNPTVTLSLPVETTDFLIAAARWINNDVTAPAIADDAFNDWIPLYVGNEQGIWICPSPVASDGLNVSFEYTGGLFPYDADAYVMKVRGFSSASHAVANGSGPPAAITLGSNTFSLGSVGGNWSVAMFTFTDGNGGTFTLLVLLTGSGTNISGQIQGWDFVFPNAATSWSTVLDLAIPEATLASTVLDICERAGLDSSMVDVSLLTPENVFPNDVVQGYAITRPTAATEIIKTLFQAFFFDACESDGTLRFVPRGLPPALTIPEADLGLLEDQAKVKPEQIAQAWDLPRQVTVLYNDIAMAYQQGKQQMIRSSRIVKTKQQTTLELPLTMDSGRARQIAEKTEFLYWLERNSYASNLWRASYMLLDPTDVVEFIYEGDTFLERLVETLIGQGYATALKGVSDNANNYLSSAVGGTDAGYTPQPLQIATPTVLFLFDIPLLRDIDSNPSGAGWYRAMSSTLSQWPGATLERSSDNANFSPIDTSEIAASFGYATTALGAPRSPWTWDRANSLTLKMSEGTLSGDSILNVLNGSNAALLQNSVTGIAEVIQFTSATLNTDGTYTLSGLLRGRRGTEPSCSGHAIGDLFVLLPAGMAHEDDPLGMIGQLRYYEGVTAGQAVDPTQSQQFTNTGNDLRPYAPAQVAGSRDGAMNLTIEWIRRTRIGGEWLDGTGTVPLSEDSEAYQIDILNGGSVVRTIGATSPVAVYAAADQVADFGSPQVSVSMKVYQISGEIGRGFAEPATV